jgi:hypothetical protein
MEQPPNCPAPAFRPPAVFAERGELERVAEAFGVDASVLEFRAQQGRLEPLDEELWAALENTDSFAIEPGGWEAVAALSGQVGRDWETLRQRLQNGQTLDAPMILRQGERLHLVSGNTRLMAARAAGVTPRVWIFDIDGAS